MGTYRIVERDSGKVIKNFQADGPVKAETHCPRPRGNYVIELVSAGTPARESGGLRNVSLREDLSQPATWQAVVDAVLRADGRAVIDDVQTDDSGRPTFVVYDVGDQKFRRSWSVTAGDAGRPVITLGNPEEVQLVVEPVEAYVFAWKDDPDQLVTIRAANRQQAHARLDTLNRLAESFGLSGQAAIEFIRGRDTTSNQVERFAALLGNGPDDRSERTMRMAREAARGRD
jgi:hypothetical protein